MVMGDDSCSRGRGFESRRHILDGHFFTFICSKNKGKEAEVGTCFLKNCLK